MSEAGAFSGDSDILVVTVRRPGSGSFVADDAALRGERGPRNGLTAYTFGP